MFIRFAEAKILDPAFVHRYANSMSFMYPYSSFLRTASKKLLNVDQDDRYLYVVVDGIHWGTEDNPRPNANGDAFHKNELLKMRPDGRIAYQTWIRKGNFLHHDSEGWGTENHVGFICDVWPDFESESIKMLVAVDKQKNSDLIDKIKKGEWTDVSMGCTAQSAVCSRCKNIAYSEHDLCDCVQNHKGKKHPVTGELVFEWNLDICGKELSWVTIGADPDAKIRQVLASRVSLQDLAMKFAKSNDSFLNRISVELSKYCRKEMNAKEERELTSLLKTASTYLSLN